METPRTPKAPIDLSARVDWRAEFARRGCPGADSGPLEVEIGAGAGGFALGYAKAHPQTLLVAFEIRKKLAQSIESKARAAGLRNLIALHADAKAALPRLFSPGSLSRFHIQFPDPWWKKRHHERRLVDVETAILLYNLLEIGGEVKLRTDVEGRGREMCAVIEAVGFENAHGPGKLAPFDPEEIPSSRERGYLERGQPVYRYTFRRRKAPPHWPAIELPETEVGMEQRRR